MTEILTVSNLTVRYADMVALNDVSADIKPGEIVGLIGPNGAGKTSFIKALCGGVSYTGDIAVTGQILKRGHKRQHLIGLVPQDIALYGHMTARENLAIFAQIMGIPRKDRQTRVEAALEAVDLMQKANTRVTALSGGMKRRINVAAAIMHKPRLLILDEPTAGTDVPARDAVHRLAQLLSKTGMGVLLVTHELDQAEALCDRVIILSNGHKLAQGPTADILGECFGRSREVIVRFSSPPDGALLSALAPFKFCQGELPTIWTALTDASEVSFVSAFMTSVRGGDSLIREVTVRRPGLTSLMHYIEREAALPETGTSC